MTSERLTIVELEFDSLAARGLREYVRLVAVALGLRGQGWLVQLEPPANVYIALDERLRLFPARDTALLWDEEHGWSVGVESNLGEKLLVLGYLGEDVFPAPEAVARAVRQWFVDAQAGNRPPGFRAADDSDDLPTRLTDYAVPVDPRSGATVSFATTDSS